MPLQTALVLGQSAIQSAALIGHWNDLEYCSIILVYNFDAAVEACDPIDLW